METQGRVQPLEENPSSMALQRLSALTPLSILITIAVNGVAIALIRPSMIDINNDYENLFTPKVEAVGLYWFVLYALQVGFAVLTVVHQKVETREVIISGVGLRFCIANFLLALWAVFWSAQMFSAAAIVLVIQALPLLSIYFTLMKFPVKRSTPLDAIFIHTPMRMFLMINVMVDIWQTGFMAFHWDKSTGKLMPGLATALLWIIGALAILLTYWRRDLIIAIAAIYWYAAIIAQGDKSPIFMASLVILLVAQSLLAAYIAVPWHKFIGSSQSRQGVIRLPEDETV